MNTGEITSELQPLPLPGTRFTYERESVTFDNGGIQDEIPELIYTGVVIRVYDAWAGWPTVEVLIDDSTDGPHDIHNWSWIVGGSGDERITINSVPEENVD
jgi:hypothetical protein